MSFEVRTIPTFERQAKLLSKKYPSFKKDLSDLFDKISQSPFQGTPLAKGFYKVRLSIKSNNKGKSGGARVITFLRVNEEQVVFTAIYMKSDAANISQKELDSIFIELSFNQL